MSDTYCPYCGVDVQTKKKFNWIIFILGAICLGVGAIIYLIYYWIKSKSFCVRCNSKVKRLGMKRFKSEKK